MDGWQQGELYERYMGRWSRPVAARFLTWLDIGEDARWLDVGCGTGALSAEIVRHHGPASLAGVDSSAGFIAAARRELPDASDLRVGSAEVLPFHDGSFDAVVSGIALNFVPDPHLALREMRRVTRPGGEVGVYLWDYADGMEMIRAFWDVAVTLDPDAALLDEAARFPLCRDGALSRLFQQFDWGSMRSTAIDAEAVFADFDDLWDPFLGEQGPAPTYVSTLSANHRDRLRDALRIRVLPTSDGSIRLRSRAWAVAATL